MKVLDDQYWKHEDPSQFDIAFMLCVSPPSVYDQCSFASKTNFDMILLNPKNFQNIFANAPSGIAYLSPEQLGKTILLHSQHREAGPMNPIHIGHTLYLSDAWKQPVI
jgi:hypothetical protein